MKTNRRLIHLITPLLFVLSILATAGIALAGPPVSSGSSYEIFRAVEAGAGASSSAGYQLLGLAGEPSSLDSVSSASYSLRPGYRLAAGAGAGTPPTLTAFSPVTNTIAAPLDSSVVLTYSAAMSSASVTSQTVAVHSMMQGLITGTHSVNGAVVTVDPGRNFFPGELVYAVATTRTTDITGMQPVSSTVWQFTAVAGVGPATFDAVSNTFGPSGDETYSLALGDVDGDGDLDAAVGNFGEQNVVYLNNGDGSFAASGNTFGPGNDRTNSLALGDVDGDGDLDAAVGNFGGQSVVYLNNGDGSFAASGNTFGPSSDTTNSVALGDVDGDGDLDAAVGNHIGQNVVYLNNGDGSFAASGNNFGPSGDKTYSVALGDVDGDGDLDAAVGNYGEQNVVYLNNGDGTFAATGNNFGTGSDFTFGIVLGDVDGDGDLDAAVGNEGGQNVVYLNNGDGNFAASGSIFGPSSDATSIVALGDVDGDGDLDAAVGNDYRQNMVYLNNGDGTFAATGNNFGTGSDFTFGLVLGDVDGDGDLDVAVGNSGQNAVWLNEPPPPNVTLGKTVTPASAKPGDSITYTLTFSNAGTGTATGVVITDSAPVSVTNPSVAGSSGAIITQTGAAPDFVWQVANLAPNAGGVITLTGVLSNPLAAGVFTNTATITASSDNDATNNSGSVAISICNNTITVQNNADSGAGSLRQAVGDVCPGGTIDFNSSLNGSTITLTGGEISINKTLTIDGLGRDNLTVSGNNAGRIFNIIDTVTIDGLTLRDGYTTADGGAIQTTSALTLTGMAVISNSAYDAGAIYADDTLNTSNTQFISNTSATDDGAVFVTNNAVISGSLFRQNQAQGGYVGALYVEGSLTLTNTNFISNTASAEDGAVYADGDVSVSGGLFQGNVAGDYAGAMEVVGNLTISGTRFISNTAATMAGALYLSGDDVIVNSLFQGNRATADEGGAITVGNSLTVTNTRFINNAAGSDGGAINASGNLKTTNSLFAGNSAGSGSGAALELGSGSHILLHTTIASATLGSGAAIKVAAGGTLGITNSIIANYTTGISTTGGTVNEDYNLFAGNSTDRVGVTAGANSLSGTFAEAGFVDAANGDFHIGGGNLGINRGVDAGIATDFDGDTRPGGGGFDMGYDETSIQTPHWTVPTKTANPADTVQPGELIEYTITVTNTGSLTTSGNIFITDTIPANTTFDSSPYPAQVGGGVLTLTVNSVTVGIGQSKDISWRAIVDSPLSDGTIITNTAYGVSGGNVAVPAASSVPVTVTVKSEPLLKVTKTANTSQVTPGDLITYTITYENIGTITAPNTIWISDTIPANTSYVSSNPTFDNQVGTEYSWFTPSLTINTPYNIELVVRVDTPVTGSLLLTNTAIITSQGAPLSSGGTDDAVVTVQNVAPVAVDDPNESTSEDVALTISPLGNDSDANGDSLTISAVGSPPNGTAVISGTTQLVYTPPLNYSGTDVFTYTASDGALADTATITVTVSGVNDAPVAVDDPSESTSEDTPLTISPLGNDSDPNGDTLSISAVSNPVHGTASISGSTQVVYTPPLNYSGTDVFTYTASDNTSLTDTATVTVTVNPVNDAPQIFDENPTLVTHWGSGGTKESQFISLYGVEVDSQGNVYVPDHWNDRIEKFDSDGNFISAWGWGVATGSNSYEICTSNCQAGISGSGNGQFDDPYFLAIDSQDQVYVANYSSDRIQKFSSDGTYLAQWSSFGSGDSFDGPYVIAIDTQDNVYVGDYDNYRVVKFDSSGAYLTEWDATDSDNGDFYEIYGIEVDCDGNVYVYDYGYYNVQKFDSSGNFLLSWDASDSANGDFSDVYDVVADCQGNVYVPDYDYDNIQKFDSSGTYLEQWPVAGSPTGMTAIDSNGYFYVADYYGDRILKYGLGETAVTMSEDGSPTAFDLTLTAFDAEGDTLTWSIATQPISGTATASGAGITKTIGYTPPTDWHGTTVFTVAVSDGTLDDTVAISVTVESVNDAPQANDDSASLSGGAATVDVLANDSDVDGDQLVVTAIGPAGQGTVVNHGDGTVTYSAGAGFNGSDVFTYTVEDAHGATATAQVDIGGQAGGEGSTLYLPLLMRQQSSGPDLVIDSLSATENGVTLVIRNQGNAPVDDAFWVDVYFDPNQPPTVNQPWPDLAAAGLVWGVTQSLSPGESLTLTSGGAYFDAVRSSSPPFAVGATVYAYVDSVDFSSSHGAVQESSEDNNRFGPETVTAGGSAAASEWSGGPVDWDRLPGR